MKDSFFDYNPWVGPIQESILLTDNAKSVNKNAENANGSVFLNLA